MDLETKEKASLKVTFFSVVLIKVWKVKWSKHRHHVKKKIPKPKSQIMWKIFTGLEVFEESNHDILRDFYDKLIIHYKTKRLQHLYFPSDHIQHRKTKYVDLRTDYFVAKLKKCKCTKMSLKKFSSFNLSFPVRKEQIKKMIKMFSKKEEILHPDIACRILEKAASALEELPNINNAYTGMWQLTIVGDIHGSMNDLVRIFNEHCLPSSLNPYIFNGDYVDYGPKGIEVLLVILMCFLAYPNSVFLNRGSHEDPDMNDTYGFTKEILKKYGRYSSEIFRKLKEVYRWLPLATILNNKVFVVHSGISDKTRLSYIKAINRSLYISVSRPPEDRTSASQFEWYQVYDLLWSYPTDRFGIIRTASHRKRFQFNVDVTQYFLDKYNFLYMVRSHDCKREGFEEHHDGKVISVFSISSFYAYDSNKGCSLVIDPGLHYNHFMYLTSKKANELNLLEKTDIMENAVIAEIESRIKRKHPKLVSTCAPKDKLGKGLVPLDFWCATMSSIIGLYLPWKIVADKLNIVSKQNDEFFVYYKKILNPKSLDQFAIIVGKDLELAEYVYGDRSVLQNIFQLINANSQQFIDFHEFYMLTKDPDLQLNHEKLRMIFSTIDLDGNDKISMNEFFEAYRISRSVPAEIPCLP